MTVTLTYDPALSRVRITADTLAAADTATIERSTDQILWTTVRGGAAVPVPQGGLVLPGTAGNYASTPDTAVLDITGDVDLRADAKLTNWASGASQQLIGKYTTGGNQRSYRLAITGTGLVQMLWSDLGSNDVPLNSTIAVTPDPATGRLAVRATLDVDNGAAGHTATFYTAATLRGPWVQLGAPVVGAGTTSIFSGTAVLEAGSRDAGTANLATGTIYAAEVRNGINGTVVASPRFNQLATGTTGFTDTSGRVWTVNGTATISGGQITVDDYEFVSGMANHYRIRGIETGAITLVGVGVAVTGNNASLAPAGPADYSMEPGDTKIVLASIRNSGTGTVNVPAGWAMMRQFGNAALLSKVHAAGDATPTVTFSGGIANADTLAQMAVWMRADSTAATGTDQLNGSAQNVAYPALTIPADNMLTLLAAWKQDDTSGVTTIAGMAEVGEASSTAGDDASQAWDWLVQGLKTDIVAGSFTFGGGGSAISRAAAVAVGHASFLNQQTGSITPVLDRCWLKSVTRPFLNRPVTVVDWSPEERPSRNGAFPAVGRTLEIGVSDVAGGIVFDLDLHVSSREDAQTLDYIRASGDILFLHIPLGCEIPGGHVCLDTSASRRPRPRGSSRVFTLPLRQCAAPGPDVVGATSTWQTVLNSYASWAAVLAANPTWADLLARVAPPSEVIVA